MGYLAPFPERLHNVEFVRVYFHLEATEAFELPELAILQLRRELLRACQALQSESEGIDVAGLRQLLMPELPSDPVLARQVQKPSPALVLSPQGSCFGRIRAQQRLVLPVLLLGPGIQQLEALVRLLDRLGSLGLYKGRGRFVVEAIEGENAAGRKAMLSLRRGGEGPLTPPICDLGWWLERRSDPGADYRMTWLCPVRLMARGKPLFRAAFNDLFPFVLRRVSGLLACYGQLDLSSEASYLIGLAGQVETVENRLRWKDWRRLENGYGGQNVGGLVGDLVVRGDSLAEIAWILQLGSLFNVGKGAAFGAGQYQFNSIIP